ncbi:MAG: hypothetical protein CMG70_04265 [Candidatus Marinimicrobia bacterium]|nr:hypothetical protein [Candidatus Neomarinimicrobiota bacterium]|tara:strand:- start:443 stop:1111 length:669 start_codon:yes stop_codon:yes gene_type:complete
MKSIILSTSLLLSLFLQGCYTQLAIFYPDPEIESNEEDQFYDTYKRAFPSMKGESYAQDGRAGMPLAYSAMQRRVYSPYSGYYYGYNGYYDDYYHSNPFYNGLNGYRYGYNGYNSYGYYAPYLYTDDPVGYGSIIPMGDREKRKFTRDRSQGTTTMLYTTRSSNSTNGNNTNSSTYTTNSSSVSSTRSSGSYSSSSSSTSSSTSRSSSSSSSSGGRRATRRK